MALIVCDNCGTEFDEAGITVCPKCSASLQTLSFVNKSDNKVLFSRTGTFCTHDADVIKAEGFEPDDVKLIFTPIVKPPKYSRENPYTVKSLLLLFFLFSCLFCNAQKKPTLMILPSDNWCTQRYFTMEYDNQGTIERLPNYQQAFQEDIELGPVISKIGELMTTLGYSLKDAEMELKNLSSRTAEDNVTTSKSSGSQLAESPLDMLKRKAKADILIQLGWIVNSSSLSFTIEAFDSYTSKRIATSSATVNRTAQPIPIQLQQAVEAHIKPFDKQLDNFYSNMKSNGREIVLTVKIWDNWENDLESEFGDDELLSHIQNWLANNTVKQQFNLSDATEDFAQFEQVMIPLKNDKGTYMDARSFARELQKHLNKPPFNIQSKLMMRGLGEAILVLGEK